MTITMTQAFRTAKDNVGVLYSMGRGRSAYNVWSERHRAWWQGHPQPTNQARENRCKVLVYKSLVALGWDKDEAHCISEDDRFTGDYRSRVRAILKAHKPS